MAIAVSPHFASHPGECLRAKIVAPQELDVTELAWRFGVSRQAMSTLLNGRVGLGADMAIRPEGVRLSGYASRMQTQLLHLRQRQGEIGRQTARSLRARASAPNMRHRSRDCSSLRIALGEPIVSRQVDDSAGTARRCFADFQSVAEGAQA